MKTFHYIKLSGDPNQFARNVYYFHTLTQHPVKHLRWSYVQKIKKRLKVVNYFPKMLPLSSLTKFRIHF